MKSQRRGILEIIFCLVFTFTVSLPSYGENDHGSSSVLSQERPQLSAEQNYRTQSQVIKLQAILHIIDNGKKTNMELSSPAMYDALKSIARALKDGGEIFQNQALSPADLSVLQDNIDILMEYAMEVMSARSNDINGDFSHLQKLAAENIKKKWNLEGETRRKGWEIQSPEGLSPQGKMEMVYRHWLTTKGTPEAFESYASLLKIQIAPPAVANTRPSDPSNRDNQVSQVLDRLFEPGATEPGSGEEPKTSSLSRLKRIDAERLAELERVQENYEKMKAQYRIFYNKNIRGRSAEEVGDDLLAEARRRSKELRSIESDIRSFIDKFPKKEISEIVERFKQNPKKFVEEESEALLEELRREDPKKAEAVERLVKEYKGQAQHLETELAKLKGKSVEDIAQDKLQQLRKESASVRQLESDIGDALSEIREQEKKIKAEVDGRLSNLRAKLNGDVKQVEGELKKIEGEIIDTYENTRRKVERDLRELLGK